MKLEDMTGFPKMYEAYKKASRGKRCEDDVIRFELDLSRNLWSIIEQLEDRTYRVGRYKKFMIFDPKEREIQALSFRDRVVQHSLCDNILMPFFENRLIYDNCACRVGKGTHFAMDRLTGFLAEHYKKHGTKGYILKYDIRHYFDSVDHEVLKRMLRKIPDDDVRALLYMIIDSYSGDEEGKRGIPIGNQTSQWFALYYLDPMDRLIKEKLRIKHYVRYMDDGILVHESKEILQQARKAMEEMARTLKLEFNKKTQIFPISQGVDFLGFRFYLTGSGKIIRRLRTSNKKRWKRRLRKFKEAYRTGEKTLDDIMLSMKSYRGHLSHGHTYKLQKNVMSKFVLTTAPKNKKDGG